MTGWYGRCEKCDFPGNDDGALFTYIENGLVKFQCKNAMFCSERQREWKPSTST